MTPPMTCQAGGEVVNPPQPEPLGTEFGALSKKHKDIHGASTKLPKTRRVLGTVVETVSLPRLIFSFSWPPTLVERTAICTWSKWQSFWPFTCSAVQIARLLTPLSVCNVGPKRLSHNIEHVEGRIKRRLRLRLDMIR